MRFGRVLRILVLAIIVLAASTFCENLESIGSTLPSVDEDKSSEDLSSAGVPDGDSAQIRSSEVANRHDVVRGADDPLAEQDTGNTISNYRPSVEMGDYSDTPGIGTTNSPNEATSKRNDDKGTYWISVFTAAVLFLSVVLAGATYLHQNRPIMSFSLLKPSGYVIKPVLENLTNTDAVGLVVFTFVTDKGLKYDYEEDKGAYNGKWVWNFPAGQKTMGVTNIRKAVRRISGEQGIPGEMCLFLEVQLFYRRLGRWRFNWFKFIINHLVPVYSSPISKWELRSDGKWAFVPAYDSPPKPTKVHLSSLRKSPM